MYAFAKRWLAVNLSILVIIGGIFIAGCDDEKKPVIHWKVFRENAPKDFTLWVMPEEPKLTEGFVCWEQDNTAICVSGKITIQSYIAGEK